MRWRLRKYKNVIFIIIIFLKKREGAIGDEFFLIYFIFFPYKNLISKRTLQEYIRFIIIIIIFLRYDKTFIQFLRFPCTAFIRINLFLFYF